MIHKLNRKQFILILLLSYVIAYLMVGGMDNMKTKNDYEKAKIESYRRNYYENGY